MNTMDVALICKALGDSNRLQIVQMLSEGEKCGCKLLEAFEITQPTLSHHMRILTECGLSLIHIFIAPVARKVIGVEIVEEAVEAAKENAALNGLDNCEFIAGDVLKVIDDIEEKPDYLSLIHIFLRTR